MNELSLFSGAGGGLIATKHLLGWRTIGYVEFNDYCQRVIAQRIKDGLLDEAPIFGDIKTLTKEMLDSAASLWYNSNKILKEESDMSRKRKNYDEAVKLYESGLSIQDVADFYQITRQAMWDVLRRRDVKMRSNLKFKEDNHFYRGGITADDNAQNILEHAIAKGIIIRKTHCEQCNSTGVYKDDRTAIQAHHDDYNKPVDVKFLCKNCHHEWHKNNKAILKIKGEKKEASEVIDIITAGFP